MADWKAIYEEKFNEGSKGYEEQKKQYEDAKAGEQAELQRNRDTAMANAKKDMENASQQAYISRVMAEKNMPQRLAAQGISGGMTETTSANIFRDFLNSKNAANSAYSKASTELENGYLSNSARINSSWAQKMADLDAQRQARALEQAKLAYQIAVDEEERRRREEEEQRKREEEERIRAEEEARRAEAAARKGSGKKGGGGSTTKADSKRTVPGYWYNGIQYTSAAEASRAQAIDNFSRGKSGQRSPNRNF